MNIPLTPTEATGWTVSTILLILAIWFFYSFIIYPKQHEKNKAKQERADEEKSRREADEHLPFRSALHNN